MGGGVLFDISKATTEEDILAAAKNITRLAVRKSKIMKINTGSKSLE